MLTARTKSIPAKAKNLTQLAATNFLDPNTLKQSDPFGINKILIFPTKNYGISSFDSHESKLLWRFYHPDFTIKFAELIQYPDNPSPIVVAVISMRDEENVCTVRISH